MTYYIQVNRSHVTETVLQAYLIKTENLPVTSHFNSARKLTGTKLALTCVKKVLPPPQLYPQGAYNSRHVPTGGL
jgi:hypothetical protein